MFLAVCECVSTPNPNAVRTPVPHFTSGTPHEQHVHPFRQNSRADVAEVFVAAAGHALHPSSCHRGYKQPLRTQLVGSSLVQNEAVPGQQVTPQRENNTLYHGSRRKTEIREKQENIMLKQRPLSGAKAEDPCWPRRNLRFDNVTMFL